MNIIANLTHFTVNMFYLCMLLYTFGTFHLKTLWRERQTRKNQEAQGMQKDRPYSTPPSIDRLSTCLSISSVRRPSRRRPAKRVQGKKQYFQFQGKVVEILETITEEAVSARQNEGFQDQNPRGR
ncbi:uncharacterized protein LOC112127178 [Cimex lectularius]|uniref:Uncharacterized protein n=1 Tax=Cimex lectularius TaxID=79782 RepID=A0A8I6SU26_CIMLE|nr:uncharacterized protein LOC112127177 [Cimex lectularius]XP_024083373.1 uncharacterized protein LOC112127178 [Cimex lectularius]